MNRRLYILLSIMEEADEVSQRVSKLLKFGPYEVQPGHDKNNVKRLYEELADLDAVIDMAIEEGHLPEPDTDELISHKQLKRDKVNQYFQYSMDQHFPKPEPAPKFNKGDQVVVLVDDVEYAGQISRFNNRLSELAGEDVYDVVAFRRVDGVWTPTVVFVREASLRNNLAADLDIVVFPKTHLEYALEQLKSQEEYVFKAINSDARKDIIDTALAKLSYWQNVVKDARLIN